MSLYVTAGEWDSYVRQTGVKIANGDDRPRPRMHRQQAALSPGATAAGGVHGHGRHQAVRELAVERPKAHVPDGQRSPARERAARAGTTGPFPSRSTKAGLQHRPARQHLRPGGRLQLFVARGQLPPNAFGMYDMHGNVYERVADCEHPNYVGAPTDGSAWVEPNCEAYQIRGNDWGEAPVFSRSGNHNNIYPQTRGDWIGFRVVREL